MDILGIDIGGSGIKGAPVDLSKGAFSADRIRIKTPSPATPGAVLDAAAEISSRFAWKGPVGVGFPGVIREQTVLTAVNLHPDWVGLDFPKFAGTRLGSPARVINDADAAGLAEMEFGIGRDTKGTVVVVVVGTGIGTAVFHNGVLFPNTELGHLPMEGSTGEKLTSDAVRKAEDLNWEEWGQRLNRYLLSLEALLRPDYFILGGGVSKKLKKFEKQLRVETPILQAALKNHAGIIGAALAARDAVPSTTMIGK